MRRSKQESASLSDASMEEIYTIVMSRAQAEVATSASLVLRHHVRLCVQLASSETPSLDAEQRAESRDSNLTVDYSGLSAPATAGAASGALIDDDAQASVDEFERLLDALQNGTMSVDCDVTTPSAAARSSPVLLTPPALPHADV